MKKTNSRKSLHLRVPEISDILCSEYSDALRRTWPSQDYWLGYLHAFRFVFNVLHIDVPESPNI